MELNFLETIAKKIRGLRIYENIFFILNFFYKHTHMDKRYKI